MSRSWVSKLPLRLKDEELSTTRMLRVYTEDKSKRLVNTESFLQGNRELPIVKATRLWGFSESRETYIYQHTERDYEEESITVDYLSSTPHSSALIVEGLLWLLLARAIESAIG